MVDFNEYFFDFFVCDVLIFWNYIVVEFVYVVVLYFGMDFVRL